MLYARKHQISTIRCVPAGLAALQTLKLANNALQGRFPNWGLYGTPAALQTVDFSGNQLTGSLPANFWNLSGSVVVICAQNRLNVRAPLLHCCCMCC
jgi:hypothetical protein